MAVMEAKSEIRIKFFDMLFGEQSGWLCIATTDRDPKFKNFRQEFFNWPRQRIDVENFILKAEGNKNVYFCINLLEKAERKKEYCLKTKLIWADLDNVNPDEFDKLPPPIVIKSSPGRWQAIWRMPMPIPPFQAEEYSKRIAYLIGADKSGWDLTQLLRVPYTQNFKYSPPAMIELERCLETEAKSLLFEALPPSTPPPSTPIPEAIGDITAEHILYKFKHLLTRTKFFAYYNTEPSPEDNWSAILWKVINECFRCGMSMEETFIVAKEAKCNKYKRDFRPVEDLWREVVKAADQHNIDAAFKEELLEMPELVPGPDSDTFVDDYREWASGCTDAVVDYHDLCIIVALSAIVSNSVRLSTSAGSIVPNLWGILLGDSTLTRKTTSMRLIMDILVTLDNELVFATDGSPEGLLSALAERPNRASIFFKDEISGFFNAMRRKEYNAGMQEMLTALYDVPPFLTRRLRKEIITVESSAFIFLGGGIPGRVSDTIDESFVDSGFLPRFLIVEGEADLETRRPLGPPTEQNLTGRMMVVNKLADITEDYSGNVVQTVGGQKVLMPKRVVATLTDDAWRRSEEFEKKMLKTANKSVLKNLALPTFDRLSRSTVKMAVIFGAIRQKPINEAITINEGDMINAAWYIQRWGQYSIKMFANAGKDIRERVYDKAVDLITDRPGIKRGDIGRYLKLEARDLSRVLETLEERGLIYSEKRGKATHYYPVRYWANPRKEDEEL